jgi:hypothetical protein
MPVLFGYFVKWCVNFEFSIIKDCDHRCLLMLDMSI